MNILDLFKIKTKRWCPMCCKYTNQTHFENGYYKCLKCNIIFKTGEFKRGKKI
jgi:ribosomal protein L37AE/L43A